MNGFLNAVKNSANKCKANLKAFVKDNSGMELLQFLVLIIIAIVLGSVLLKTANPSFSEALDSAFKKLMAMFS